MFFNSGTISNQTGGPIIYNSHLLDSIGATTAQPATFVGGDLEFQGAINLFRPATGLNGITVNNNTTFSGGWTASTGTATNLSGVQVNGTGTLTLSGNLGLDVPLTVSAATVNINSAMTSSGANVSIVSNGTVKIGVDDALNSGASLTVGASSSLTGTFNMNGHDQTVAAVHLLGGTISGVGNTLTSTTDFDVQSGTANTILAGSVGLVKTGASASKVILPNANTYTGATTVNGGTLSLTGTLASPTLSLGGGTLEVNNGTSAVAFSGGTTLTPGSSSVTGTTTGTISLGAITRNAGSTQDFTLPANPGTITTTTANSNFAGGLQSILGGYATVGGSTAAATWAVSGSGATPGSISGLATYSASFSAGTNVDAPTGASAPGSITINSLRLNGAALIPSTIPAAVTR